MSEGGIWVGQDEPPREVSGYWAEAIYAKLLKIEETLLRVEAQQLRIEARQITTTKEQIEDK